LTLSGATWLEAESPSHIALASGRRRVSTPIAAAAPPPAADDNGGRGVIGRGRRITVAVSAIAVRLGGAAGEREQGQCYDGGGGAAIKHGSM
jgi:hypothetical protein